MLVLHVLQYLYWNLCIKENAYKFLSRQVPVLGIGFQAYIVKEFQNESIPIKVTNRNEMIFT